jgi:hypothetical protein
MIEDMFQPRHFGILVVFILPVLVAYIALICYIYQDAGRRGMQQVLWTLLALFVPSGIGVVLYFILRQPLLVYCAYCRTAIQPGLAYCPRCGHTLAATCPQCRRVCQAGWSHCGWCGAALGGSTGVSASG